VSFDVTAQSYGSFMGRFSEPLALAFADFAQVPAGAPGASAASALDVGCGTGALTAVLVDRLGAARVSAVDPSASFVDATRERLPDVDVRAARAEDLPYAAGTFDLVLAQLVVHFMSDPARGIAEMARVAAPGGVVAATVWDHGGAQGPLATFWAAARALDPGVTDESSLPGVREGSLEALFTQAGLTGLASTALSVDVAHESFEQWWEPFTLGVGPAGAHVATLTAARRDALREECRTRLPAGPFATHAVAWAVRARPA
jgi:SAM-dependent methyltransferase